MVVTATLRATFTHEVGIVWIEIVTLGDPSLVAKVVRVWLTATSNVAVVFGAILKFAITVMCTCVMTSPIVVVRMPLSGVVWWALNFASTSLAVVLTEPWRRSGP